MSAASFLLTEDQFLCSICLDVFTDPVTTPCGHNFCKNCIMKHWNINVSCQCPNCKKGFYPRPELQVNTFISEMAAQFRQSAQQKASSSSSQQQIAKPGVCTGTTLKALTCCLVYLISVFVHHIVLDHKTLDDVRLSKESAGEQAELGMTEAEIHQMIETIRLQIQEIRLSVEVSREDVEREIADNVQAYNALKESVERTKANIIETIEENQRATEEQAEDFIKELEQEISELMKRLTEVEQVSGARLEESLSETEE